MKLFKVQTVPRHPHYSLPGLVAHAWVKTACDKSAKAKAKLDMMRIREGEFPCLLTRSLCQGKKSIKY